MSSQSKNVFVTGGTGFMGRSLIAALVDRGHAVQTLVRPGSEKKVPAQCTPVTGNALDSSSYVSHVPADGTFVQLIGVTHPNPTKTEEFRAVDLGSAQAAIGAATQARISHFVYVSVAQPAPVMKGYAAIRAECEDMLTASGLNATILRPWYVLGAGRRWPYLLVPMYWIMRQIPATRESAERLGLVTLAQMVATLVAAVENPPRGVRILGVPEIRQARVTLGFD